ncbi:efflux RND transporter periplasmic adaptor subunit [Shewanella spartinae]|uniref:efflux RND transporter periplasmic adaptor subunit n=1 Tax=Shewanella spartinae TaxID=2864205 RepID=UPI001C6576D5|nr:efflux RND transporter periplasmic adaptor subunit [Shewanella spartinae]QYJ93875.1 efflux RND transporter periplasmic adaptor subunit [Shewanella spartinae]
MRSLIAGVLALSLIGPMSWAQGEAPERLVQVVQVENRALSPKIMVIGSVHSRNYAELTAGIEGKLEWVIEAGTLVKAGEVVARIEKTRLELQKAQQEAQIEYETVGLSRLNRELKRLQKLMANKNASETELDKARSDRDLAAANLKLAQIKLKMILDDIARTQVKAPFAGIITARQRQAGEDISRAESIVAITDPDNLEIRLHAPLKHSRRVKVGDELRVYHGLGEFSAQIRSLIPVSDVRSQTFEARIDLPLERQDMLNVGELVSLALPIAPKQLTTLVPRDAVVLRSAGAFVFKIDESNKAVKVAVELGDGEGEWIAVKGELSDSDQVVIRGAETLQDGQQVKVQANSLELSAG